MKNHCLGTTADNIAARAGRSAVQHQERTMSTWITEEVDRQRRLDLLREAQRARLIGSLRCRRPTAARRLLRHLLAAMRGGRPAAAAPPVPSAKRPAVAPVARLPVSRIRSVECPACVEEAS